MAKAVKMADPATCSALHEFQMHHMDLMIDVNMKTRRVMGEVLLLLKKISENPSSLLRLDVFHLKIHSVQVENKIATASDQEISGNNAVPVPWIIKPFTAFGEALEIQLPDAMVATQNELRLRIKYETDPESPGVCWLTPPQTAGKKLPYMYTQGQEVLNRSFFPCQDSPSVRITYSAAVAVPSDLVCVMSAKLCTVEPVINTGNAIDGHQIADTPCRRFKFEMQQSIPVYLVAMAVGDLVSAQVGPRSSIWTEPCMLEACTKEFDGILEKYITIGEELFGPYQWEQYDLLVMPPSFPYGGMENPRLTFVSPTLIAGDQSLSSVVAHEISHSWFGNLVTNSSWSDFFLNEGFTMYAERRITEVAHGRPLMCLNAKLGEAQLRQEIASLGEDHPLTRLRVPLEQGIDPGDCYNECAYEKGYAFVAYLRSLVGSDKAFDAFLTRYCEKFRFQSIPAEEMMAFFLESFPELADGSDLKGDLKFATWLHEPGYPRFTPDLPDANEIIENCESLAFHWRASSTPVQANVLYLSEEAMKWPAFQLLYFLDCCYESDFTSSEVVEELGNTLNLWSTTNAEVKFRWSQILIKNQVVKRMQFVADFLTEQGKQKFQIPLYRVLTTSPSSTIRSIARTIYTATKPTLHVMVRDRVEALLNAMPQDE